MKLVASRVAARAAILRAMNAPRLTGSAASRGVRLGTASENRAMQGRRERQYSVVLARPRTPQRDVFAAAGTGETLREAALRRSDVPRPGVVQVAERRRGARDARVQEERHRRRDERQVGRLLREHALGVDDEGRPLVVVGLADGHVEVVRHRRVVVVVVVVGDRGVRRLGRHRVVERLERLRDVGVVLRHEQVDALARVGREEQVAVVVRVDRLDLDVEADLLARVLDDRGDVDVALERSAGADYDGAARVALGGELLRAGDVHLGLRQLRSEEHTSELQSRRDLVCRLLLDDSSTTDISTLPYTTLFRSVRVDRLDLDVEADLLARVLDDRGDVDVALERSAGADYDGAARVALGGELLRAGDVHLGLRQL